MKKTLPESILLLFAVPAQILGCLDRQIWSAGEFAAVFYRLNQ